MNKLLERQIQNFLSEDITSNPNVQKFLQAVSDSYDDTEADQELMNRSLSISSKEMMDLYQKQKEEADTNKKAIDILKSAVLVLDPTAYVESIKHVDYSEEVISLAEYLSRLTVKYDQNVHELTIQKIHAEALSSELQIFKYAVENAANYIMFLDSNLKVTYANKAALFGKNLKDIIGKTIDDIFSPVEDTRITDVLKKHVDSGDKFFTTETTVSGRYNMPAIVKTLTTVSHDVLDRSLIICISNDVTKERTLEREKDEFVSIASHELKTPLTVIRGYLGILLREQLGQINNEQREIIEKINNSTRILIDFTTEMLDLTKIEENKFTFNPTSTSLQERIDNALEKVGILFKAKDIVITTNITPTDIYTDQQQLDRILSNLLSNAYKFTNDGGSIDISNTIDENNNLTTICVADTGIGIPSTSIDSLFKKFSQVKNVLSRQIEGTGLGLAICKSLVENLGGNIWVKSKEGEGSQFYFTMPLIKKEK